MKKVTFTTAVRSPIHGPFAAGETTAVTPANEFWIAQLIEAGYAVDADAAKADAEAAAAQPPEPDQK